jgi:membrane-associated phospholipid phosphatase
MISFPEKKFVLRYFLLFAMLFCFGSNAVYSQQNGNYNLNFKSFNRFLDDGKQLAINPLHWETYDWVTFSAVTGGTLLLTSLDTQIKNEAQETPYKNTFPMIIGKWTGEPIITFGIVSGFYLYGIASDDNTAKRIGFEVAESFIYAGTINLILKGLIGRFRPYMEKGNYSFSPFKFWDNDNLSFPSGHSTVAFSLSTILASHTDNYFLKAFIYAPALLTLVQRIKANQHWTSDVFAGAALGYFIGRFIVNKHNKQDENNLSYEAGISQEGRIVFYFTF